MEAPRPWNLRGWIEANPDAKPSLSKSAKKRLANPNRSSNAYSQARQWISKASPAIEGQGGHAHTFGICCALIKGFCLSIHESTSLISEWNITCSPPWSDFDLQHKLLDAESAPDIKPRGWMLAKHESVFVNFNDIEQIPETEPEQKQIHSGILDDPASIAVRFVEAHKTECGLCEYRWWNGQFYAWNGSHYDVLPKEDIEAAMFWFIEKTFMDRYEQEKNEKPLNEQDKVKKRRVSNTIIANVKTAVTSLIRIDNESKSEPFWLLKPPSDTWSADQILPTSNRLVHIQSFVNGNRISFMSKSPKYFSTYQLDYRFPYESYDGPVDPPPQWDKFLDSVWHDDLESILCLQEWMGYFLTPCTSLEKMLMLIGQKRSGKGTILRTIKHMLGSRNVCYPTFKSLTTQFGKQSLIGKSVAVFPDARITSRTDVGDVVECLLSISGEDEQTIERKYQASVTKRLTTRFVISSNELPRLTENSGALVSRAVIIKFDKSFLGSEDIELEEKLKPEVPLILRWAIDGWKRLFDRGKFLQPASGAQVIEEFLNLSSPISHFMADCVDEGYEYETDLVALFEIWESWCKHQRRDNIGDMANFMRNLRSSVPSVRFGDQVTHNGDAHAWSREIKGLRPKAGKAFASPVVILSGHMGNGTAASEETLFSTS
jgi:putative DNA primase/helicase